jgi:hypothetical protein
MATCAFLQPDPYDDPKESSPLSQEEKINLLIEAAENLVYLAERGMGSWPREAEVDALCAAMDAIRKVKQK